MKTKKFIYRKNDKEDEKNVFVLNETDTYIVGIDLAKLDMEEKQELYNAQKTYEEAIEPFVKKAFRKYLTEKILLAED